MSNYTAFFIKQATDCGGASGVYYFDNNEIDNLSINLDKIVNDISNDIAIQELVIQHDDVAKLNPSSVNTLRILTLLGNDGNVKVYSTLLRIGGGYTKVDNFCSGGMAVGVADNGKLKKYGYYLNGNSVTQHPLSKIDFLDYQLPSIDKAKELVKKAHIYVPHFRMVSWDVAIEKDGTPILIEANLADGQLDLHQLTNGPLFKEDTKKILDEVFNDGGNV